MSHPIPGHDYSEPSYESHSPHKEGGRPKGKALKKMKTWKSSFKKQLNDLKDRPGENHLDRIKRLLK